MASGLEDMQKVAALPKEGVHCYAASSKQITSRRIITAIVTLVCAAASVYFFTSEGGLGLGVMLAIAAVIAILVFVQTFMIADYRVAVDYNTKEIVLRYRFSKVRIPFENLDSRDGEVSKAEEMLDNATSKEKTYYLVFDDVYEDVCFQTSTNDLASREDFFKLKEEAFAIADAYGARNSSDAIKPITMKSEKEQEEDIEDIVKNAMDVTEDEDSES